MDWARALAFLAMVQVVAPLFFFAFWRWFQFWRPRPALTYAFLLVLGLAVGAAIVGFRRWTFAGRLDVPVWTQVVGWAVMAVVAVFGTIADRQIGFRVRAFVPFFDARGHIDLKTTGAYGVVRHPIYAAGSGFGIATFLVTGYPGVLVAWTVFTLGALWFTGQEERRLTALLDDPAEYERYRERVPALLPRLRRSGWSLGGR